MQLTNKPTLTTGPFVLKSFDNRGKTIIIQIAENFELKKDLRMWLKRELTV